MRVRLKHSRLARELLLRSISQNRWAQMLGLSPSHLSMLANGQRLYPRAATRRKLLRGLGLRFEDLFELEATPSQRSRAAQSRDPAADRKGRIERVQKGEFRMRAWAQDLRQAWRMLSRKPLYGLAALLTLGLGIGGNTAIFSVVQGVMLRPLPFQEPERLVRLWSTHLSGQSRGKTVSLPNFFDWREQNTAFQEMAAIDSGSWTLQLGEHPLQVPVSRVSDNFFDLLGVEAALGRLFLPGEDLQKADPAAVLSHAFWKSRMGGDRGVLGRIVKLREKDYTIVGVLPESFEDPALTGQEAAFWVPFQTDLSLWARSGRSVDGAIARLKPAVSLQQAQQEMIAIAARLALQFPPDNQGRGLAVEPLHLQMLGNFRTAAWVLLGAVGLVLAVGCVNLANLSLSHALSRRREMAVRAALGAGRGRIVRQLLSESLLLAAAGGALGVLLAAAGIQWLLHFGGGSIPRSASVELDGTVLLFSLALSLATAAGFGLAPALQLSRTDVRSGLASGSGRACSESGNWRLRSVLVMSEVALSLLLLVGAGLLIRSFWALAQTDPGFRTQRLLTFRLTPLYSKYTRPGPDGQRVDDKERMAVFYGQLAERLSALAQVKMASAVTIAPLTDDYSCDGFYPLDRPRPGPGEGSCAETRAALPGYLEAVGLELVQGRTLTHQDQPGSAKAVWINQQLASRYWPDDNPIGKPLGIHEQARRVEGVFSQAHIRGPQEETPLQVILPWSQDDWASWSLDLVVRTALDPAEVMGQARQAVWGLDADMSISEAVTIDRLLEDSMASPRFRTALLAIFASSALILALVGIGGVLSYTISQRVREIGIRMALGADAGRVMRNVLAGGLKPVLLGLAVGLAGSLALSQTLSGLLFQVSPFDPLAFLASAALLLAAAMVACYLPARRASRLDPLEALRME